MEVSFTQRSLKLSLRIKQNKHIHSDIILNKDEYVDVHSDSNFGTLITHYSSNLLDTEMVCILYQNHFYNIPLYYLKSEGKNIKTK